MNKRGLPLFFTACIWPVLVILLASQSNALTIEEETKIVEQFDMEVRLGAIYDFGCGELKKEFPNSWQKERLKPGAKGDCSGKLQACFYRIGKFYKQVGSANMAQGKGNWKGKYIGFSEARPGTLAFMTFTEDRHDGHVGAYEKKTDNTTKPRRNEMAHASSGKKRFVVSIVEDVATNPYWAATDGIYELD